MNEPTPYSSTDTAETEAVSVLVSLLNPKFIKADIRVRDKFPNTDGYIELVNEKQVPIGKLDVQVKKIQTSANKASCPSSLVAYSQKITLPILFIGVDIENNKAYWKHIHTAIPEFKDSQETFTIKFNETHDSIDSKSKYIKNWTDIIEDYQARMSGYPELKDLINNNSPANTLDAETNKYFQEFSDTVNRLFEYDFIVIKEMLFKDVWKFGVTAHKDKNRTSYGIYKISYGDQAPLICTLTKGAWDKFQKQSKTLRLGWAKNDYLEDAEAEGEKFVFDKVDKIVTNCKLPIHGNLFSTETLFYFLDKYVQDRIQQKKYTLNDIICKLESYLEDIAKRHSNKLNGCNVRFEKFSSSELTSTSGHDTPLSFSHCEISSYEIKESIRYLISKEFDTIERPYPLPDDGKGPIRTGNWIWCGYTQESENMKIHKILSSSLEDYKEFVNGNKLKMPESLYLDSKTPIIYIYHSADGTFYEEPSLDIYYIHEPSNLPKLSVYVNSDDDSVKGDPASGDIIVDGTRYTKFSFKGMSASFLFYDRPTQKLIYKMLYDDLENHYKNLDNLFGNW